MDWHQFIRPHVHPMKPYAPGLRGSEVRSRTGRDEICKLSSNENPYGPFPRALVAGQKILAHLNRYPDGSARDLKSRLSHHLGVSTDNLIIGNGSNELLVHIAEACLAPGDEVVYGWPSFVVYPMICELTGATAVPVPLTGDQEFDLPAILSAITDATKIVFLCNPNNPTGTIYTKKQFDLFIDKVPDHVLVVLDEAYFEYCVDERYPNGLDYFDGDRPLVVLRTFSKIYSLAGIRCGYGVMPPALVQAIDKVREPFNVNTMAQAMAYYSLDDEAELSRRILENADQRARLCELFDSLGIGYAESHTNFIYISCANPADVFEALLSHGVIVRDFGNAPALRVGIGSPEDTNKTIAAFRNMASDGLFV